MLVIHSVFYKQGFKNTLVSNSATRKAHNDIEGYISAIHHRIKHAYNPDMVKGIISTIQENT